MAQIRWEPVPVNRLLTSLFDTQTAAVAPAAGFTPPTDIVESDSHYILRTDLPGVAEDDVAIELDGNVLSISGERRASSAEHQGRRYRYERSSGHFRRTVRLPQGIDADGIEASFDRGVLEVSVPKPVRATPRRVAISTPSSAERRPATEIAGSTTDAEREPAAA